MGSQPAGHLPDGTLEIDFSRVAGTRDGREVAEARAYGRRLPGSAPWNVWLGDRNH